MTTHKIKYSNLERDSRIFINTFMRVWLSLNMCLLEEFLIRWGLENILLSTHLLLRKWWLLILLILVRIGIRWVAASLVEAIAFISWLKWNFLNTCFKSKERIVSANCPRENREEWEQNCASNVATANSLKDRNELSKISLSIENISSSANWKMQKITTHIWWICRFAPLRRNVTESNEIHESPQARKCKIGKDVMLSTFSWWHLIEKIFASDKSHWRKKSD